MRRLARYLLAFFCAIALLVCVIAGGLWARNPWVTDRLTWDVLDRDGGLARWLSASSWWGSLVLEDAAMDAPGVAPPARPRLRHTSWPGESQTPPFDPASTRVVAGFGWGAYPFVVRQDPAKAAPFWPGRARVVLVPWYAIILATAAPPALWLAAARRRARRRRLGLCLRCGYDLRASAGGCPECGAAGPEMAA